MIDRIDPNYLQYSYPSDVAYAGRPFPSENIQNQTAPYSDKIEISQKSTSDVFKLDKVKECQTCKRRKYQDISNDPSVSFKAPTHISPEASASAVSAHEYEHVSHESAKAKQEGKEVVSQSVQIQTAICPECGRVYVAGGKTTTVTKEKAAPQPELGRNLDKYI